MFKRKIVFMTYSIKKYYQFTHLRNWKKNYQCQICEIALGSIRAENNKFRHRYQNVKPVHCNCFIMTIRYLILRFYS